MKKNLLLSAILVASLILCSFNSKAQYQYTATHPHHHIAPSCTFENNNTRETWSLSFELCPDQGVYVTYSEIVIGYVDMNGEWVELTSANSLNSSTGESFAPGFTVPTMYQSLSYYFWIEYNDGTTEMVTVDY